ncbi:MAG: amidohydrolase [Ruminococcus sp.]|nr:amidohydrolase [Ruminococcus sp.]
MRYIDFHTHAFTDALAERAMSVLSDKSGISPLTDGTVRDLRRVMAERDISAAVILPIATKPSQQTGINNWAAGVKEEGIICFGSVHPEAEDRAEEVQRIKALGLRGIKFHPEYQQFSPDDEGMFPVYEKMAELGLIAVFHGGWDPYGDGDVKAVPESFAVLAETFPELKIVAAHMGGLMLWEDSERYLAGKYPNLWFDTGVVARYLDDEAMLRLVKKQGAERVLFGSDCPWDDPLNEIALIERLPLSQYEKEKIFFRNAEELLGLN